MLAGKHRVHPVHILAWKSEAVNDLTTVFTDKRKWSEMEKGGERGPQVPTPPARCHGRAGGPGLGRLMSCTSAWAVAGGIWPQCWTGKAAACRPSCCRSAWAPSFVRRPWRMCRVWAPPKYSTRAGGPSSPARRSPGLESAGDKPRSATPHSACLRPPLFPKRRSLVEECKKWITIFCLDEGVYLSFSGVGHPYSTA